jgi:hypothetical protein
MALLATRGLGKTRQTLATFGIGLGNLTVDAATGCVIVRTLQPTVDYEALSDEALVDIIIDSLELQFLGSSVVVEIRGPTVVMSTRAATVTLEVVRDAAEHAMVVARLTSNVQEDSATQTYANATASPDLRGSSTTIQTGDCD